MSSISGTSFTSIRTIFHASWITNTIKQSLVIRAHGAYDIPGCKTRASQNHAIIAYATGKTGAEGSGDCSGIDDNGQSRQFMGSLRRQPARLQIGCAIRTLCRFPANVFLQEGHTRRNRISTSVSTKTAARITTAKPITAGTKKVSPRSIEVPRCENH